MMRRWEERFDGQRADHGLRLDPRMSGASEAWHVRWSSRDSHGVVFVPVAIAGEAWQAELHALNYLLCRRRPIAREDMERRAPILVRSDNLPRLRNLLAVSRQLRDYFRVLDTEYADLPFRAASPGMPWPDRRTEPELAWATDHLPGVPVLKCPALGRLRPTRRALADASALDPEHPAWESLARLCAGAGAFDSIGDTRGRRLLICDAPEWAATVIDEDLIRVRPASTFELVRLWSSRAGNPARIRRRLTREADPKARASLLRLLLDQAGESALVRFADGQTAHMTGHAVDRAMTRMNAATPESAMELLRRMARRARPRRLPKLVEFLKPRAEKFPADYFGTPDGWEFTVCEGQLVSVYFRDRQKRAG